MNYVESYPSVVSKPIQKWTLTEIGKNSTVTTTLRETRSDSCSKCTKGGAISVEIRVTTRRLSPPIDDEEEDRTSPQLRNDCDWRWPEGLAPLLNLDAHLSLRNWELKPGHVAPLRLVGTHLSVRHWALEGNQVQLISNATRYYYSASSWASHRYLLLDERTEYFEWLCTVQSRCFGLPPGLVSLGGNSAFLSGYEAGSAVGYLCVKWVRMLVKSPQSCAFAMVPTLMVLTPLVNNDPLLVTHGIAAFHSGVKVASLIATDGSVLVVATPLATNLLLDHCLDFVRHRNSVQAKRELAKKRRRRFKALRRKELRLYRRGFGAHLEIACGRSYCFFRTESGRFEWLPSSSTRVERLALLAEGCIPCFRPPRKRNGPTPPPTYASSETPNEGRAEEELDSCPLDADGWPSGTGTFWPYRFSAESVAGYNRRMVAYEAYVAKYLNEPYDPERAWEQMRHATDIAGRTTSPLRFRCQPCLEPRVEQVGGGDEWPMVNGKLANFTKTNAYKWRDWYEESDYYTYKREREEEGDGGGADDYEWPNEDGSETERVKKMRKCVHDAKEYIWNSKKRSSDARKKADRERNKKRKDECGCRAKSG